MMTAIDNHYAGALADVQLNQSNWHSAGTPSIADQYAGMLDGLSPQQRSGLIDQLASGYYDGWRPTRPELAGHIRRRFGVDVSDFVGAEQPADVSPHAALAGDTVS
jgi:hypothetical protein